MAPPHYWIVAAAASGNAARAERRRTAPRRAMYSSVEAAARSSGLPWDESARLDLAESLFLLLPATLSPLLITTFVARLDEELRRHNQLSGEQSLVRMRVAIDAGFLERGDHGWFGATLA